MFLFLSLPGFEEMTNLQYVSLSSTLDPGFWHVLSKNKLDEYGLSDEAVPLHGFYSNSE